MTVLLFQQFTDSTSTRYALCIYVAHSVSSVEDALGGGILEVKTSEETVAIIQQKDDIVSISVGLEKRLWI